MNPVSQSPSCGKSIKAKQTRLYNMSYDYLLDNFHKFSEANKIKIALQLTSKMVPTQLEGGLTLTQMPAIVIDGQPLEPNIGN